MARQLGSHLTGEIIRKIKKEANLKTNEAVLLVSVDDQGFPNVALLSYLDISVVSSKKLVLAIGENSSSKKNLTKRRIGTLVFWVGEDYGLYYVKGKLRLIRERLSSTVEGYKCSAFLMKVEGLSQDHSTAARLLSTVTYDPKKTNLAHGELFQEIVKISKRI